jgi:hypothetical protein
MVLVDASVWISHFRTENPTLRSLLEQNRVSIHPFVIGELACGTIKNRDSVIKLLSMLPHEGLAQHDEVLYLVDNQRLWGSGIGWIDAHLLTSALLSGSTLWTVDRRLANIAKNLKILAAF